LLERIELRQASLRVYYRHAWIPQAGAADPLFVREDEGRWGTTWTLHTALSTHVALSEYCRSKADDITRADPTGGVGLTRASLPAFSALEIQEPLPRRSLFGLTFTFERLCDLTGGRAQAALRRAGFDTADFFADDFGQCQQLAHMGAVLGWEALLVPSAAWRHDDGLCAPILSAGRPRLQRQHLIDEAVRPTVAVAYGTTYKFGERPRWLTI